MSNAVAPKNTHASKKAFKHGTYSKNVVLQWEDRNEFDALHQAIKDEYGPQGASEEETVFDLACLHWKKRRISVGTQLAFHTQPEIDKLIDVGKDGWEGIVKHLKSADDGTTESLRAMTKQNAEALKLLYGLVSKRVESVVSNDASANDLELFEKIQALAKELNILGTGFVMPIFRAHEVLTQNGGEQAHRPDIMEREFKLHTMIDRQIEKTLRRLVMIKEYKKLYAPKSIDAK